MASVQKVKRAGGTRYRAVIRVKGFPTKSATFFTRSDARRWAEEHESKFRLARIAIDENCHIHTLDDAITRYIRDVAPRTPKSFETIQRPGQVFDHRGAQPVARSL